jgi:DNA (cytosine-5)-methyltransferase 1
MGGFSFIDLFAGAGGFTLGLERAGGATDSLAVEADPDCAETFRRNFPCATVIERDIRDVDFGGLRTDLVVAGPPCQGFSLLNRRREGDPRRILFTEVIRCVDASQPEVVVVENVASFEGSTEAAELCDALAEREFRVRIGVVNAADYGVPQRRQRAITVAARVGRGLPWPRPTHGRASPGLPAHRTVADAFSMLSTKPTDEAWHRDDYRNRSEQIERLRSVREGGSRRDLPPDLVLDCWKAADGFNDVLGRLAWHRPATTIRTEFFRPEKGRFLHPNEDRPITPREAARLQSFPDDFEFPAEQTLYSVARQIGNAMPPRLAEAIGSAVAATLSENRPRRRSAAERAA